MWYYSRNPRLIDRFWVAALFLEAALAFLFFLPWVGRSGLDLAREGDWWATLYFVFVLAALGLLLSRRDRFLKIGASIHFANNFYLFFAVLMRLLPGTFLLDSSNISAVISMLVLLLGNPVLLLLWHELDKGFKLKGN